MLSRQSARLFLSSRAWLSAWSCVQLAGQALPGSQEPPITPAPRQSQCPQASFIHSRLPLPSTPLPGLPTSVPPVPATWPPSSLLTAAAAHCTAPARACRDLQRLVSVRAHRATHRPGLPACAHARCRRAPWCLFAVTAARTPGTRSLHPIPNLPLPPLLGLLSSLCRPLSTVHARLMASSPRPPMLPALCSLLPAPLCSSACQPPPGLSTVSFSLWQP